jgi:hypothetical protein
MPKFDAVVPSSEPMRPDEDEEDSFVRLAHMSGGESAKNAFLACLTTLAVVVGLILSFVVPSLTNPPAILKTREFDDDFRVGFGLVCFVS